MMRSRIFLVAACFVIVGLLFSGAISMYAQTVVEDTVSVTATVAQDNMIIFSGDACPSCQVFLLLNDVIMDFSTAGANGSFQLNIQDIDLTTHQFGIYAVDQDNVQSGTSTFSVDVSQGAIIYISDILISPTLRVNNSVIEKDESVVLSGHTVPNGEVTIELDGASMIIQTTAFADGGFYHTMDASNLNLGVHSARAMAETLTDSSGYSLDVGFNVVEVPDEEEKDDEEEDEEEDETVEQTPGSQTPGSDVFEREDQDSSEVDPGVKTGGAIDFFVAVTNEGGKVAGGEYLNLRLVVVNVAEQNVGKDAKMRFSIVDSNKEELVGETYDFVLGGKKRLEKRLKLPCSSMEGEYLINAEIEFDGQKFEEEATAIVSRGRSCGGSGLKTSLLGGGFNFEILCGYTSLLLALVIILLILVLILIYLLIKKEEEKEEVARQLDKERNNNHKKVE